MAAVLLTSTSVFSRSSETLKGTSTATGVVASYTSLSDVAGATATVSDGEMLYLLCPTA